MGRERLNELLTTLARPSKENDELQDIFSRMTKRIKDLALENEQRRILIARMEHKVKELEAENERLRKAIKDAIHALGMWRDTDTMIILTQALNSKREGENE